MKKLYILVRDDLAPGAQLVQSVHAALAFAHEHPELVREWHEHSNNIAALQVRDEPALLDFLAKAGERGIPCSAFREPDFGDAATALAMGAGAEKIASQLPLALKEELVA